VTAVAASGVSVTLERTRVVDDVTLGFEGGEWVALIGPNGAGKTTLLRAVAGLVPYEGSIGLDGEEVASLRGRALARRIAVVPQIPVIPADMGVLEYVVLGRTPHLPYAGAPGPRDADAARSALGALDALHLVDRRLGSLSGGERQRAVLARAVAQDAGLLLLDEPTSALDVGAQQQVLELVASLRVDRGLTVLSAMHDLTLAGQYADRLVLMDGGREVASGGPDEVLTEELIRRHYGASVRVVAGEDGPTILPLRPRVEAERAGPRWP
jgi:iron complex transport system ATP-binding protein